MNEITRGDSSPGSLLNTLTTGDVSASRVSSLARNSNLMRHAIPKPVINL